MIDRADRGKFLFLGSIAVSAVLVLAYLAAGGSDYAPAKTQDPCKHREWRNPEGLQEIAQQFSLSALDGAACKLGVSRETLAQALATEDSRQKFLDRYDIERRRAGPGDPRRPAAGDRRRRRSGRPQPASWRRRCARRSRAIPLDQAIELVNDARSLFEGGGSIVGLGETASASSKASCPNKRRLLCSRAGALERSEAAWLDFLKVNFWDFAFQRIPAQSASGVVPRAPQSFTIVPRRGSRPPRSSSEISVLCSSQRKPSSSWEICLLWRALRRLTAKRSRGSIWGGIFCG